ncbi:hypothetical protein L798_06863 [Zootermopsis nevadensis]|uniref:Uncharacterized protein n=1 Tax=Zootermopsis nevadensis TaxID=136037 RepID=A0A067R9R1_ZOONE|nr:hypothetical protein L798_06863 [Zootermopsis nevadensis]
MFLSSRLHVSIIINKGFGVSHKCFASEYCVAVYSFIPQQILVVTWCVTSTTLDAQSGCVRAPTPPPVGY